MTNRTRKSTEEDKYTIEQNKCTKRTMHSIYISSHLFGTHKTIDILLGARDESLKQPLSGTIKVKTE